MMFVLLMFLLRKGLLAVGLLLLESGLFGELLYRERC